jgi:gliding motility-associated-like protein
LGYPTTNGAYSNTFGGPSGGTDVVVTKYNATGTNLLYSTYLGGNQTEIISSMIVDLSNNLCIYGATGSSNFPTTTNAYDPTFNGGVFLSFIYNGTSYANGTDIYVSKFNTNGTALLASTFIGGNGNDGVNHVNHTSYLGNFGSGPVYEYLTDSLQYNYGDQYRGEIQVDVANNIYIASSTRSSNFPIVNGFDNTLGGKQDAVVIKFNTNLTQLLYSTYLGGNKNESGNSLVVNNAMEVFVTGGTCSNDFPITSAAHSTVYNGGKADGYITHINAAGNGIMHSTYVGTFDYDQSYFVQLDKYNNVFVYGQSLGTMPIVNSGTIVPFSVIGTHQFVSRYSPTLSNRTISMVFGHFLNAIDISPCAFAVDKCNNLYLSGWGGNILGGPAMSNMPLFQPTQSSTDGYDFYFMGLDSNFVLKYGSYFGGAQSQEHVDGGTSRFDARGKIYQSACAGCMGHDDWPVTNGAWPNTPGNQNHSTNCNNGVVKLDFQLQITVSTINTGSLTGCVPYAVTFTNTTASSNPNATYKWYMGNGVTFTNVLTPSTTYTAPGVYTVALVTNDNLTCNKRDSTITYVTVLPAPQVNTSVLYNPCATTVALSGSATGSLISNPYTWNFGDGSPNSNLSSVSHTYGANGIYTVSFSATDVFGCSTTKTQTISVFNFVANVVSSASVCYGNSVTLNAMGGTAYSWLPSSGLSDPNTATPVATPGSTTIYTVNIVNNSTGGNCSKTMTVQLEVKPTPTANFNYTLNPCGGGASFTDLSQNNIVSWNWVLAPNKTSTVQNPYNFYTAGGTYTISLTTTNAYGCKDRKEALLKVLEPPPVSVNDNVEVCKGTQVQLNASGGVQYQWFPEYGLNAYNIPNPVANPLSTTVYSVVITTTGSVNGNACSFLLTSDILVDKLSSTPIGANANPQVVIIGNSTTLSYTGDLGATLTWYPANLVKGINGYTASASPDKRTTYTVVAKRGACVESVEVVVDAYTDGCLDNDTFIPNTFTPNGDGQNDVLFVRGLKITDLYFAVYNRWGEPVFETKDKNQGWDGKYKGKPAEPGVYGWYIKVTCITGKDAFKKGNVTLLR